MERKNRFIYYLILLLILPLFSFRIVECGSYPDWLIDIPELGRMPVDIDELDSMSRSTRRELDRNRVLNCLMPIDYHCFCDNDINNLYNTISYSSLGRFSISDTCIYVFFERNYDNTRSVYMSACVANKKCGANLNIYDSQHIRPDSLPKFSFKYNPDFPNLISIYSSYTDFDETKTDVATDFYILNSNLSPVTNDYLINLWIFSLTHKSHSRLNKTYDFVTYNEFEAIDNSKDVIDFHGFIIPIQSVGSMISLEELPYGTSIMPWDIVRKYLWPTQNEIGVRYPYGGNETRVICYGIFKYEEICLLLYMIDYPYQVFLADLNTVTPFQKYPKTLCIFDSELYECLSLEEIIDYFQ